MRVALPPSRCAGHTSWQSAFSLQWQSGLAARLFPVSQRGLERVRHGVLRAGVIEHPPWVVIKDDAVRGIEAQLLEQWAAALGARVEWRRGDLDELVKALHRREIDVLAAGFHHDTPYAHKLALTQPHSEATDAHGKTTRLVLAVTPGESAMLFDLDRFLARVMTTQP